MLVSIADGDLVQKLTFLYRYTDMEQILLAGGDFQMLQKHLRELPGVIDTQLGFSGGTLEEPTYEEVIADGTGHALTVLVKYDPAKTDLETLLKRFFALHDPTTLNRQGSDVGTAYRSAIFCVSDDQKAVAEQLIAKLRVDYDDPIVTFVEQAGPFYAA